MKKVKLLAAILGCCFLSACGSMSFGETTLNTIGVFFEASEIRDCYDGGGSWDDCEGGRY